MNIILVLDYFNKLKSLVFKLKLDFDMCFESVECFFLQTKLNID